MVYFDEDQIEKWVTINGARTPILKDGSIGFSHSINADFDKQQKQLKESENKKKTLNKTSTTTLKDSLKQHETTIKNNGYETGICLDKDGNEIFTQKGNAESVEFTDEQIDQLPGTILTHNHPKGTCFSSDDLYLFEAYGVQELRAVSGERQWRTLGQANRGCSISRTNKPYTRHPSYLSSDYASAVNKYTESTVHKFYIESEYDDVETVRRAEKMTDDFKRRWLREHAVDYGFQYKEFRI